MFSLSKSLMFFRLCSVLMSTSLYRDWQVLALQNSLRFSLFTHFPIRSLLSEKQAQLYRPIFIRLERILSMVSPSCLILIRHMFFHSRRLASVLFSSQTESYLVDLTMLMTLRIAWSILYIEKSEKWCYLTLILERGLLLINSQIYLSRERLVEILDKERLMEHTIVRVPLFSFVSKNQVSWLSQDFNPSRLKEWRKFCQSFLNFSFFFDEGMSTRMIQDIWSFSFTWILAMKTEDSFESLSSSNFDTLKSLFLLAYKASLITLRYQRYQLILIQVESQMCLRANFSSVRRSTSQFPLLSRKLTFNSSQLWVSLYFSCIKYTISTINIPGSEGFPRNVSSLSSSSPQKMYI